MKAWQWEILRAWRASLRRPVFLLLAAEVLALGVGSSAVAFNLIDQVRSMQSIVVEASDGAQTGIWICGVFATMALLLAGVGLYAVMSVAVAAREHELGVRSALGAPPARLGLLVVRNALSQVVTGLALGMVLAAAFPRLFEASFAQLGSHAGLGPWVAGSVCVLLLAFALLACLAPAIRAGRIQPMRVLQGD